MRHSLGPTLEFLSRSAVTGDKTLVDAVGAHRAPLVVIAAEPEFGEIRELVITRDQVGWQVAVVVVNRLSFCVAVIKLARLFGGQQEIVMNQGSIGFWHGEGVYP